MCGCVGMADLPLYVRNKETKRDDFVFFTNRLACLVMEYTHSLLPFQVSIQPQ